MKHNSHTIINFNFNIVADLGCDKVIESLKKITSSDLLCYCTCPPWPNMKIRFDTLMQFLMRHKISNSKRIIYSKRIISNRKKTENQFERKALIEMNSNSYSWTNSLHIEMINLNPTGPIGPSYGEVANTFAKAREYEYLALHPFEYKVSEHFNFITTVSQNSNYMYLNK